LNILILEEALQSGNGHWPVYIGDITLACRQSGDHVDVLAHRHANSRLLQELQAIAWFSQNCWTHPSSQGGLGGLKHAWRYARELSRWLRGSPEPTWVCALTMRLQHLLAFAMLCRRPWHQGQQRFLLLFVQGFGEYQGPQTPVTFPPTPSTRLARWCFRRLAPAVMSGRVVLAAETRAMQAELECFSNLPVRLFPHPVAPAAPTRPTHSGELARAHQAITITCPGFARYEKGNDLLQDACKLLFAVESRRDLEVICQWPDPFTLPDGSLARPDPELLADGRYQLINNSLDRESYADLLARSDLIVLPYRRSSYHNRVSRVAIEAAIHCIPLVYMSGTWCEEVVELTGAGVAIAEETPQALSEALQLALDQLPELRDRAAHASGRIREHYSAQRFRQLLLAC
jgi:hypothetical protein